MIDRGMDGIILVAPVSTRERLEHIASAVPTVVIGRHGTSDLYDTVVNDDVEGASLIVGHLAGLGHRRIAHIEHHDTDPARLADMPNARRADGYPRPCEHTAWSDGPTSSPPATPRKAATRARNNCWPSGRRSRTVRPRRHLRRRIRQHHLRRTRPHLTHQRRPGRPRHGPQRRPPPPRPHHRPPATHDPGRPLPHTRATPDHGPTGGARFSPLPLSLPVAESQRQPGLVSGSFRRSGQRPDKPGPTSGQRFLCRKAIPRINQGLHPPTNGQTRSRTAL